MGELIAGNSKGLVSVSGHAEGFRLRWRVGAKRPELYIPASQAGAEKTSRKIKIIIEQDLLAGAYDASLNRYRLLIKQACLQERLEVRVEAAPIIHSNTNKRVRTPSLVAFMAEFDRYLAAKSLNPMAAELSSYYTQTKAMLRKWGEFHPEQAPILLRKEVFGAKTFNDRRNCLVKFFSLLVRKGKLSDNPPLEVSTKKRQRNTEQRKPFTEQEVAAI